MKKNKLLTLVLLSFSLLLLSQTTSYFNSDISVAIAKINTSFNKVHDFNRFTINVDDLTKDCMPCYDLKKKQNFNPYSYSRAIKESLSGFILRIPFTHPSAGGRHIFSFDYLGKKFFDDYYIVYQDDLTRYVPQPVDIMFYRPQMGF